MGHYARLRTEKFIALCVRDVCVWACIMVHCGNQRTCGVFVESFFSFYLNVFQVRLWLLSSCVAETFPSQTVVTKQLCSKDFPIVPFLGLFKKFDSVLEVVILEMIVSR